MSAFIVSTKHIDYLVTAAALYRVIGSGYPTHVELSDAAHLLEKANHRSVIARYGKTDAFGPAPERREVARAAVTSINPVQVIKAARCLAYQSCEFDGWDTSDASRFCEALISAAESRLPGYDAAAWAID